MEQAHKRLLLIVNAIAFAAIVWWLSENISLQRIIEHFRAIPVWGATTALALNLAVLLAYGVRLSLLLEMRRLPALAIVILGFGLNGVLPFRLGEVAKLAYARQLFAIAAPRLLAATAAEKLLDLMALLLLGLAVGQFVAAPYLRRGVEVVGILLGAAAFAIVLGSRTLKRWQESGRQAHSWIVAAFDTLHAQKNKAKLAKLAFLTAVIWAVTTISVYAMFASVFPVFSFADAGILTLVLALAIAVPSAPAGLGVVEAAIVAYLTQAAHAEPNQALASALAFHLIVIIPQILITSAILLATMFRRGAPRT